MGTIRMTVKAIAWTQGDVGHVAVALRDGICRIDWGDGRTSSVKSRISDESMIYADHVYPRGCKKSLDIFEISLTSDNDNLIGFYSGCIDMEILKLDLKECPELEKLILSGCVRDLTFRNNPNLKELDITGDAGVDMNFSNNSALTELIFWDECHLSQKSQYFINRTLERNDGKLTIEGI